MEKPNSRPQGYEPCDHSLDSILSFSRKNQKILDRAQIKKLITIFDVRVSFLMSRRQNSNLRLPAPKAEGRFSTTSPKIFSLGHESQSKH